LSQKVSQFIFRKTGLFFRESGPVKRKNGINTAIQGYLFFAKNVAPQWMQSEAGKQTVRVRAEKVVFEGNKISRGTLPLLICGLNIGRWVTFSFFWL